MVSGVPVILHTCIVGVDIIPHFIAVFVIVRAEEITVDALLSMNDDTLAKIVPDAAPRALLLARINEVIIH